MADSSVLNWPVFEERHRALAKQHEGASDVQKIVIAGQALQLAASGG